MKNVYLTSFVFTALLFGVSCADKDKGHHAVSHCQSNYDHNQASPYVIVRRNEVTGRKEYANVQDRDFQAGKSFDDSYYEWRGFEEDQTIQNSYPNQPCASSYYFVNEGRRAYPVPRANQSYDSYYSCQRTERYGREHRRSFENYCGNNNWVHHYPSQVDFQGMDWNYLPVFYGNFDSVSGYRYYSPMSQYSVGAYFYYFYSYIW